MEPSILSQHLLDLAFLSDPRLAPTPAGSRPERAAVVLSNVVGGAPAGEEEKEQPPRYRSRLQLVDLRAETEASERLLELTQGEKDQAPRWSPDGHRLAFRRSVQDAKGDFGPAQLAVLDLRGGEAKVLSSFANGVIEHAWLDDGRLLLLSTGDRVDEEKRRGLGRTVNRRLHRADGRGFLPSGPVSLWTVDLKGGGAPEQLLELPEFPSVLAVAPDGEQLAFLAPADDREFDEFMDRLWLLPLRADGQAKDLLGRTISAGGLCWSPDGKRLAWTATPDPKLFAEPSCLWALDLASGRVEQLSDGAELSPSSGGDARYGAHPNGPRWSADGGAMWVVNNAAGRSGLAQVASQPGDGAMAEPLALTGGDRVVTAFDAVGGQDAVWALMIVETPTQPGELVLRAPDGQETRLSAVNDAWAAERRLQPVVERSLTREDGSSLSYFLLSPERPRDDNAIIVQVHGGPHTNDGFGFRFEQQMQAAAGYTIVFGNPRGSSALGAEHATAMLHAYGTVDADDVLAAVDHALAQHPDPQAPVHLTGGSYGGFMTNWLVGHTDRFRSAVTQRSICNWLSFYGTSDIGPYFTEYEVGAAPWLDLETLWRQSPLRYVENVTTPILVLHAEEDHRCPIEQAEQWFSAIKRLGKAETRLVRFPGEGHELSRSGRPDRRMQNLDLILGWFQDHP